MKPAPLSAVIGYHEESVAVDHQIGWIIRSLGLTLGMDDIHTGHIHAQTNGLGF